MQLGTEDPQHPRRKMASQGVVVKTIVRQAEEAGRAARIAGSELPFSGGKHPCLSWKDNRGKPALTNRVQDSKLWLRKQLITHPSWL